MKKVTLFSWVILVLCIAASPVFAAYHHEGESDSANFTAVYPNTAGTKLDSCALCHCGGEIPNKSGGTDPVGSCQWCHYSYGYDGSGNKGDTLNGYGLDYFSNGRDIDAVAEIEDMDSDDDSYDNITEIKATRYPGNAEDDPSKVTAPYRIYTRSQLEAMTQHTQFMLMNTSRSGDFYAEYTGVPMKELLDNAGILSSAQSIRVYAPDGWYQDHPLEYSEDIEMYHVYGNMPYQTYQYPPSSYFYDEEADENINADYGWCDYSAPSCSAYYPGDPIPVAGGLKAILALKREGVNMDKGVLNDENKLDGEGPYRVVVPQKNPNAPDQSIKSSQQDVVWKYEEDWDHNAGACSRSATIIRVDPLPEGTTDIDILEAGWPYIDEEMLIIYGAIEGGGISAEDINSALALAALDDDDDTCFIDAADPAHATFAAAAALGFIMIFGVVFINRKKAGSR